MGMFDIGIVKTCKKDDDILKILEEKLKHSGKDSTLSYNLLEIDNFKTKNSLLSYDLKIEKINNSVVLNGELKEVLILTILIILSILFTYGLGLILVVGYTYYQKIVSTKYLEKVYKESIS